MPAALCLAVLSYVVASYTAQLHRQSESLPHDYHEGFEEYSLKTPDATVLIAVDGTFTYREFDEAANRIANALIARGLKNQSRVALLLPRTSRAILSMFGVLKTGCVYIPCDPAYPAERINHILEDSAAQFVITTADRLIDEKYLDV